MPAPTPIARDAAPRPVARHRLAGLAFAATLLGTTAPTPTARADDVAAAEAKYRAWLKRPSLHKRMQGRVALARTGTTKAIGMLADDYLRPEEPKDHVRYLVATLATERLAGAPDAATAFAGWRSRARTPFDAWLWYRALGVDLLAGGRDAAAVAVAPGEPVYLRAAALRALATASDAEGPATVAATLDALPTAGPERALLVESCAAVARTWGMSIRDDATRAVVERLAKVLDDRSFSQDTHDIVARNLASLFQTDVLGPGAAPWLRELAAAVERPEGHEPPEVKYAPGPFFGLRALGRRIVYVIDASDSMLVPLTPDEIQVLRPTTPSDPGPGARKLPKAGADEDPLPWQRIRHRFDAAREVLKRSLRAMKPGQHYCVILFGNDARTLATTPNLVAVDPKAIDATIAELDRVKPEPAPGDKARPHGRLRGETNLHGGLRLAFRVTTDKRLGPGEYVDLSRTGCDGIYLLSDGNPTTDDFVKTDKSDGEKTVKDRETLTPVAPTGEINFQGPYGGRTFEEFDWVTDDVRRLNLFRQAEIHCVALGDVDDTLLRGIADLGTGRFRRVGGN
jgi:hypothetical protein